MTIEKLSEELKYMYEEASKNEKVAHIHLFGIKNSETIKKHNFKNSKIIEFAGLKKSYVTELSKGIKLAKFVKLK